LGIKAMYAGGADEAERLLRPLRAAAGPALVDGYRSMRYADAAMGGTPARYLDFFPDLPDAVIKRLVDTAGAVDGAGANVEVRHWGGALARPGADGGPAGRNTAEFSVMVDAPTPHVVNGLRPYGIGGAFLNFLSDTSRTAQAYSASDYARLRTVKRAYDPENVFGVGHSILPAAWAVRPVGTVLAPGPR